MSLYDDASLVMIPSGYKDGKLYSVKPSDGAGDFTFTRGSNLAATRVDEDGLIEKGRENLFTYSNTFTSWIKSAIGVTVTSGQSGYDGSSNAYQIEKDANAFRFVRKGLTSPTGVVTFSVYMKAGTLTTATLRLLSSPDARANFNLSTGALISSSNVINTSSEDVGGGWYRYSITANMTTMAEQVIYPDDITTSNAGTIFVQDAQLEVGLVATDYIETGATTAQAGILEDMPRLDYSGGASCPSLLLEPQRTNLIGNSEYLESSYYGKTRCTIEDNSTTSPEGVINASKMTSTDALESYIQGNVTTTGTKMSWSFFAKKGDLDYCHGLVWSSPNGCRQWFNLSTGAVGGTTTFGSGYSVDSASIEDYGNGWYRCTMIVNCSAGTQGCRVNISSADTTIGSAVNSYGYFYGLQAEDASYATSYIPTYGTSVTRGADSCVGAGDSSTFNGSEGVLYVELEALAEDSDSKRITISDGTLTNRITISISDRIVSGFINVSNSTQYTFFESNQDVLNTIKIALKYKANDFALWINGSEYDVSTSGNTFASGVLNELSFDNSSGSNLFYSNAKQVLYFPVTLSNTELAALTTL